LASEKRERMRTGGGPPPHHIPSEGLIDEALGDATDVELQMSIDSDTTFVVEEGKPLDKIK
jgi:hypothetical protein